MSQTPKLLRFCGIASLLMVQTAYPVIISEFSATSNDRIFERDANGVAALGGGTQWWEIDYRDDFWRPGATPIGFGTSYTDINTNVQEALVNKTPTLYLRQSFDLTAGEAANSQTLTLRMDYDDSFIAYLNGKEIARADAGAPGLPHYPGQLAFRNNTANGTGSAFNLGAANLHLTAGENVLAIEVHNSSITSSTLKAKPTLSTSSKTYLAPGDDCLWFPGVIMPSGGVFDPVFVDALTVLRVDWARPDFDDSTWDSGPGPIGSESSNSRPYALGSNLVDDFKGNALSIYMRHEFTLTPEDLDAIASLELDYDYDDGCVIYLNGAELVRGNLGNPGEFITYDSNSSSHSASTDGGGTFDPDQITFSKSRLVAGTNVLSAQIHNSSINNSDLIMYLEMRSTGASPATLVAPDASYSYFIGTEEPTTVPSKTLTSELGFSDWIELYNDEDTAVDLSNWSLSDDLSAPDQFKLPDGTILAPGEHLLILADNQEEFNGIGEYLHASFKLASDGEDIVLSDATGTVVASIAAYPAQYPRQSYGFDSAGQIWGYYSHPTPGSANRDLTLADRVKSPDFAPPGGFYVTNQSLTLSSTTPGATIRYTTDGSEPTESNGLDYTAPLNLTTVNNKTARVIRAKAFKTGLLPSKSKVHTYLIGQASALRTAPALIFTGDENESFYKDHGIMAINGGSYSNSQWIENGPTSYNIPMQQGPEFERPIFVEFYHPDNSLRFREDAGVRLSSSEYSRPRLILSNTGASPWTNEPEHKPSFNLYFRDDYGSPSLASSWLGTDYPVSDFEQLRVRAGKNDIVNPFITDELVRRLFGEMGQASSHGIINTLYINGEYKGFFNMCERLREPFMQKHHGGNEEWDVRQVNDYANGDITAWNEMMAILNRSGNGDLSLADWQEALTYLDPVNMADYFLINIYGATWDWPQNNWVGARERSPEGRYRLYVWDAEGSYQGRNYFNAVSHNTFSSDLLSKSDTLSALFKRLIKSPEWRLVFADRIQKHLFNGGVLDDRAGTSSRFYQNILALRDDYQPLLQYQIGGSVNLSPYNTWISSSTGRRRYLFGPSRTDFASNNLWPSITPPDFSQHGGDIASDTNITLGAQAGSQIYYTTDGSDPRDPGGATQSGLTPYAVPLNFSPGRTTVKARSLNGGTWSAMTEVEFSVDLAPPSSSNLVISEFLYHPAAPSASELAAGFTDQDDFEFIELLNTSATDTIDLGKVQFTAGITFSFAGSDKTDLAPGERLLIVSNLEAFQARYGTGHPVAGEYSATLANGGELITLSLGGPAPATLQTFTYLDLAPWPACADGPGFSLVLLDPTGNPDHNDATHWTCSQHFGGELNGHPIPFDFNTWADFHFSSAQLDDPTTSGPNADPDGDGMSNFMEFALATPPLGREISPTLPTLETTTIDGTKYPVIAFTRSSTAGTVSYQVSTSEASSPDTWSEIPAANLEAAPAVRLDDGRVREAWRIKTPIADFPRRFFRIKMISQ
ncbi:lamin tail domain-containing protein [Verrucomicrobiaceae bacterium 227]